MKSTIGEARISVFKFMTRFVLVFSTEKNVIFGCYSTVFLASNLGRAIASGWESGMGFDSNGPISNTKFHTMGITTNSLGRRANPV